MYFIKTLGAVCHILEDEETGKAPAPCGAQASKLDLINLRGGKPSRLIVAEKPIDMPGGTTQARNNQSLTRATRRDPAVTRITGRRSATTRPCKTHSSVDMRNAGSKPYGTAITPT
jgi:hypothetical protein